MTTIAATSSQNGKLIEELKQEVVQTKKWVRYSVIASIVIVALSLISFGVHIGTQLSGKLVSLSNAAICLGIVSIPIFVCSIIFICTNLNALYSAKQRIISLEAEFLPPIEIGKKQVALYKEKMTHGIIALTLYICVTLICAIGAWYAMHYYDHHTNLPGRETLLNLSAGLFGTTAFFTMTALPALIVHVGSSWSVWYGGKERLAVLVEKSLESQPQCADLIPKCNHDPNCIPL